MKARGTLTQIAAFFVLGAAGLYFGVVGARNVYRGQVSRGWPTAEARLIRADVAVERDTRIGRRTRRWKRLHVRYVYSVDGRAYESSEIAFGGVWSSAQSKLDQIRAMRPLLARYDPRRPAVAVLEPGVTAWALLFSAIGLSALSVVVLMLVLPGFADHAGEWFAGLFRRRG